MHYISWWAAVPSGQSCKSRWSEAFLLVCVCVCCGALQWTDLHQVERLVDGGTSIVYTATYNQMPVIVKVRAPLLNMYTFRRSRPRINVRPSDRAA